MDWVGHDIGEGQGSDSGPYDFFGDECEEDGEASFDEGTEVRNFRNWMRKKKGERKER